jgi:biotin synthase-related radical SAM superfamily protein
MAAAPTTAYLMLGGRCLMNCAFCAQARESRSSALHLSRVTWPEYDLDAVVERLAEAASDVPFDVAILPQDLDQVRQLVAAGADHIGFGLDAACERVFRGVKGGSWARSLALVEGAARAFPGRAAVHLIVGLGETEREMVERVQWAHDLGVTVGLFAFTPVHGTHLAGQPPPPLAVYRRMQAARWLVVHDMVRVEDMAFNGEGRLVGLPAGLPGAGEPFLTSGCPDCNRPFYNEQPGGPLYNYPRPLTADEAARAIQEMEIETSC